MPEHPARTVFLGGIPTSGKTWLAGELSEKLGITHINLDDLRAGMMADPAVRPWARFFLDRDGEEYWRTTSCDAHWQNVTGIAEALWPGMRARIEEVVSGGVPAVFESVCLLPHLVRPAIAFPGVYLLGSSFQETWERNKAAPRWGQTPDLVRKDAEMFFYCERPRLRAEAEKYDFPCFEDGSEAGKWISELLGVS